MKVTPSPSKRQEGLGGRVGRRPPLPRINPPKDSSLSKGGPKSPNICYALLSDFLVCCPLPIYSNHPSHTFYDQSLIQNIPLFPGLLVHDSLNFTALHIKYLNAMNLQQIRLRDVYK